MAKMEMLASVSVADRIDAAVRSGQPFSFVRLGDGEGSLLAFTRDATADDYSYLSGHFGLKVRDTNIVRFQKLLNNVYLAKLFGIQTAFDIITRFKTMLESAIRTADLLGIRDDVWKATYLESQVDHNTDLFLDRFLSTFPLRPAERNGIDAHSARRLCQLREWASRVDLPASIQVCSSWAPVDLQLSGYWEHLISTQRTIGLIGHSSLLAERMRRRFSSRIDFIGVPTNNIDVGRNGPPSSPEQQHSKVWQRTIAEICHNLEGKVFLVGAGLVGKYYCKVIKSRGGIALDIGALLDAWDGLASRKLVYLSKAPLTASQYAPPPEFLLSYPRRPTATPRKKILLHLGFSKTGTTSIQNALHCNENALATSRARYLHAGRFDGTDINHHQLARAFGAGERQYDRPSQPPEVDLLGKLLHEMAKEIAETDCDTYIVSSELFTNFAINRQIEDTFIEWLQRYDAQAVFYVRNQFSWLASWYTQAAKNGNMGLWLDEFILQPDRLPNSERFDGNFLRKIKYFEKYIGKESIVVKSYDDDARSGTLIKGFFDLLGVAKIDNKPDTIRLNETPRDEDLMLPIMRRRQVMGQADIEKNHGSQTNADRALLRGAYASLRGRVQQLCRVRFREINEELNRQYHVDLNPLV